MRSKIAVALVLMLASVPTVQAQQVAVSAPGAFPAAKTVVASLPPVVVERTPAPVLEVRAVEVESEQRAEVVAAREPTARTALALVGAIVVVVALVALLR